MNLAVVGQAELAVQLGRDHRVAACATARLDEVKLRARQRLLDKAQFALEQGAEEPMDPVGMVYALHDQLLLRHQAAGMLPAAGLVAPDETAQNPGLTDTVVFSGDGLLVQLPHRHELLDQLNILMFLNEVFRDPGRGAVAAGLVGELALGRGDGVVQQLVVRVISHDPDLLAPFRRLDNELLGVGNPELAHRLEVLNRGVQAAGLESIEGVPAPR